MIIEPQTHDDQGNEFTAETFLSYLRRSHDQWSDGDGDWVFRGHEDADWKLRPSAWRAKDEGNKLMPLMKLLEQRWPDGLSHSGGLEPKRYALWIGAELEAVHQFSKLAHSLGMDVPLSPESPLRSGFLAGWPGGENDRRRLLLDSLLPLAQHHGIPTRLLDWTENPLAAAHFAALRSDRSDPRDIAVWSLRTRELRDATRGRLLRFYDPPRHSNPFLAAQSSVLVEFHGDPFFQEHGRWPHLEERITKDHHFEPTWFRKLVLPSREVPKLRMLLDREAITKAHLMPTLDNVAATVIARW